jgi:hypothetical protein
MQQYCDEAVTAIDCKLFRRRPRQLADVLLIGITPSQTLFPYAEYPDKRLRQQARSLLGRQDRPRPRTRRSRLHPTRSATIRRGPMKRWWARTGRTARSSSELVRDERTSNGDGLDET